MATEHRSSNICLINTQKVVNTESIVVQPIIDKYSTKEEKEYIQKYAADLTNKNKQILENNIDILAEDNTIGIDHINSAIWFDSKDDRDNYMALKTVKTQVSNSRQHNFNEIKSFRLGITMKDFYKLDIDLIKLNHTVAGLENEYFYNIIDVNYTNDGVTEVGVQLNEVYTYFLDNVDVRTQTEGIIGRTNFKNENYDIAYVNTMAKQIIGDNYGNTNYDSGSKRVVDGTDKPQVSFLVVSLRKKPNIVDDSLNNSALKGTPYNAFSDEVIISVPFANETGACIKFNTYPAESDNPNMNISRVAYLLLNGGLDVAREKGQTMMEALIADFKYLKVMPFTIASFFDIQEIGIIPDCPYDYTVVPGSDGRPEIKFRDGLQIVENTLLLEDLLDEKNSVTLKYFTYSKSYNDIKLNRHNIITNAQKMQSLFNNFENIENNIIYNKYQLKFYNLVTDINAFNLFGSNQDLYVTSFYTGKDYRKVYISTDEYIENLSSENTLNSRGNSDYVIKYNGVAETGMLADEVASGMVFSALDIISGVVGTTAAGPAGGAIAGVASREVLNPIKTTLESLKIQGGQTGYKTEGGYVSTWLNKLEETVPKVIYYRSGKVSEIDKITNFNGTTCSMYTANLKNYIKDVINNRKSKSCYIQGNFNINFMYPQANRNLKNTLMNGILFKKKL